MLKRNKEIVVIYVNIHDIDIPSSECKFALRQQAYLCAQSKQCVLTPKQ